MMVQLVSCRVVGDKKYVVGNVAHECNSTFYYYAFALILPSIVVFLVGIPLIFVVILYKNRNSLKNPIIVLKYGYLLKEYKQSTYYWEFVKMMQRMLIMFVINFYSQDQKTKAFLILIILHVYWGMLTRLGPYLNPLNNRIDQILTFTCYSTVFVSIFMYKLQYMYFYWVSLFIIAIVNLYFILYIGKMIGMKYIIQAK